MITPLEEMATTLLGASEERGESDVRDRGAVMAEYALVIVGIAVVVGVAAVAFGGRLAPLFESVVFP